jgi:hypothetical protein
MEVGYPKMREFAREISQDPSLAETQGVIHGPAKVGLASHQVPEKWNGLISRYPFLGWTRGTGVVGARDGVVELTWGSALTGHWGFQVSPGGAVEDLEEDRGTQLRVAEDIQFVYYYD